MIFEFEYKGSIWPIKCKDMRCWMTIHMLAQVLPVWEKREKTIPISEIEAVIAVVQQLTETNAETVDSAEELRYLWEAGFKLKTWYPCSGTKIHIPKEDAEAFALFDSIMTIVDCMAEEWSGIIVERRPEYNPVVIVDYANQVYPGGFKELVEDGYPGQFLDSMFDAYYGWFSDYKNLACTHWHDTYPYWPDVVVEAVNWDSVWDNCLSKEYLKIAYPGNDNSKMLIFKKYEKSKT